jgi:hypothetical protein
LDATAPGFLRGGPQLDKVAFSSDALPSGLNDRQRFLAWRELHNQYFSAAPT